jgi:uncharacterized protein YtpQ (UPF0354 family)
MMDSREQTLALIRRVTENLAGEEAEDVEVADTSLTLEDLHALAARLDQRIKKNLEILTGKDAGTAASITQAVKDDYLAKRLKARAMLMRVHQKVKHSLLVAVPYKRRISRAKKGTCD